MAVPPREIVDLKVAAPTLEPDPAFVLQLAHLAGSSGARVVRRPRQAWKIALAVASVATIASVGALVSSTFSDGNSPIPPSSPVTRPTGSVTTPSPPARGEARDPKPTDGADRKAGAQSPEQPLPPGSEESKAPNPQQPSPDHGDDQPDSNEQPEGDDLDSNEQPDSDDLDSADSADQPDSDDLDSDSDSDLESGYLPDPGDGDDPGEYSVTAT